MKLLRTHAAVTLALFAVLASLWIELNRALGEGLSHLAFFGGSASAQSPILWLPLVVPMLGLAVLSLGRFPQISLGICAVFWGYFGALSLAETIGSSFPATEALVLYFSVCALATHALVLILEHARRSASSVKCIKATLER